jgi:hypothetical protein
MMKYACTIAIDLCYQFAIFNVRLPMWNAQEIGDCSVVSCQLSVVWSFSKTATNASVDRRSKYQVLNNGIVLSTNQQMIGWNDCLQQWSAMCDV